MRPIWILEQSKTMAEICAASPAVANKARIACNRCQRSRNKAQSAGGDLDVDALKFFCAIPLLVVAVRKNFTDLGFLSPTSREWRN